MGNQTSNYNEYGCYANQVRSMDDDYYNQINRYQNQLDQNSALQSQKDNEWSNKIQQAKDEYDETLTRQETEWNNKLKDKEEIWKQQIMTEESKLQKEIEEKQAIFEQQQQQIQTEEIIYKQHHYKYMPSLSNGMYGSYVICNHQYRNKYKPSLSNGIYGHYRVNYDCHIHHHNQIENISVSRISKRKFGLKNDEMKEDNSMYEQIYAKTKEIDDKYKLIFKPECNIKGCCNKPEIDAKLLNGDMYICKKHRIEMANKIKQCGLGGDVAKDIMNKLTNMNDSELLAQGKKMVNDDYFLKSYTKLKMRQNEIIKQLLTSKRSQSKYWALKIEYKQIQKAMEFLVLIRKVSNPIPLIIIAAIIIAVVVIVVIVCCCSSDSSECCDGCKRRKENARKNKERLAELSTLIDDLSSQITDKQTMKSECLKLIKAEQKTYDDKVTELEGKIADLQFNEQKWSSDIANKKTQHTAAEKAEEKTWDDKIKAKQAEIDNERVNEENQWDGWIQQKVDFQNAVNDINNEIRDAVKKIKDKKDEFNAEIEKLENELDDETLDEAAWEKKMDRLEKLEKKREKNNKDNESLLKNLEDKLDAKKDEEKKWSDENNIPGQADINKLKKMKQWKLNSLKTLRDTELQTLKTNKQNALTTLKTTHQTAINDMETKRDTEKNELAGKRAKIQTELNTHKDVEKRKLETFKREKKEEARQLAIEEDDLNWRKAKARAEESCRNTSDGWAAVYIVYDRREYYNFWLKSTYSGSKDETYHHYGNYAVCRMEGKYNKASYRKHGRNEFRFKVKGRSTYWYHHYNSNYSTGNLSDDWTYVEC